MSLILRKAVFGGFRPIRLDTLRPHCEKTFFWASNKTHSTLPGQPHSPDDDSISVTRSMDEPHSEKICLWGFCLTRLDTHTGHGSNSHQTGAGLIF